MSSTDQMARPKARTPNARTSSTMPPLVALFIRNSLIGYAVAAVFVAGILALNVANLRHLIMGSDIGVLALFLLWFFNGIVFASVQTAMAIMALAEDDTPPGGGLKSALRVLHMVPAPAPLRVKVDATTPPR